MNKKIHPRYLLLVMLIVSMGATIIARLYAPHDSQLGKTSFTEVVLLLLCVGVGAATVYYGKGMFRREDFPSEYMHERYLYEKAQWDLD